MDSLWSNGYYPPIAEVTDDLPQVTVSGPFATVKTPGSGETCDLLLEKSI